MRINGSIIGSIVTQNLETSSGVWTFPQIDLYKRNFTWPLGINFNFSNLASESSEYSSGTYSVNFGGTLGVKKAYVDTVTDGGGWVLVLNYLHLGGTNPNLLVRTTTFPLKNSENLGTDESSSTGDFGSWGHCAPSMLNSFTFSTLRWYGKTNGHSRILHFKTSDSSTISYFKTGTGRCLGLINNSSFTNLPGESSNIPPSTDGFSDQGDLAMTNFPIYNGSTYHWAARGLGSRWEVDDYPNGSQNNTYHQIWVKA